MQGSLQRFRRRLLGWYDRQQRCLPWRVPGQEQGELAVPDPYRVLVSEYMLQQTQVATVIPYFQRFVERFPTFGDLAAAEEQEVLRLWQGLGYYSRARNLQRAARRVMGEFGGELPGDLESLRTLPGVGRYTAGAIASIAFGRRCAILDGNVMRVLCRLDRIDTDPREPATHERLWARAQEILPARKRLGDFNSALMELGALVCTPRAPQCLLCPVREQCEAFAAGVQEKIPPAKARRPAPLVKRWTYCIRHEGRWLIEQRPARGRWAGMWQFITIEASGGNGEARARATLRRLPAAVKGGPWSLGVVKHGLTHRRYEFDVYACDAKGQELRGPERARRWVRLEELGDYPLPRPQLKIVAMLGDMS